VAKLAGVSPPPPLKVRRSKKPGNNVSGHSKWHRLGVVLSIGEEASRGYVCMLICHELAHAACSDREGHGDGWRATYVELVEQAYSVEVQNVTGPSHQLDRAVASAIDGKGEEETESHSKPDWWNSHLPKLKLKLLEESENAVKQLLDAIPDNSTTEDW
jgi:hypothetical protein